MRYLAGIVGGLSACGFPTKAARELITLTIDQTSEDTNEFVYLMGQFDYVAANIRKTYLGKIVAKPFADNDDICYPFVEGIFQTAEKNAGMEPIFDAFIVDINLAVDYQKWHLND